VIGDLFGPYRIVEKLGEGKRRAPPWWWSRTGRLSSPAWRRRPV